MGHGMTDARARFEGAGQSHVFDFYSKLDSTAQSDFLDQLSKIDIDRAVKLFHAATSPKSESKTEFAPLPNDCFESLIAHPDRDESWFKIGLELIRDGKIGVVLLAGGQGTRLGSSKPKGCYDIGLPSGKSLFQLQAERIRRLRDLVKERFKMEKEPSLPWYVMTSGPTHEPTESYFKESKYFGLPEKDVIFFQQDVLPAFTFDGKVYLETPSKLSVAPDGNGGIYRALHSNGIIKDMESRGIHAVHMYCVDNCLVRVADPTFIGYCNSKGAKSGIKTVPKASPEEPVGVVCLRNNEFGVLEYSEMDDKLANAKDGEDKLQYRAANIANHYFTLEFLQELVTKVDSQLTFHVAKKKIKHVDADGTQQAPTTPNGIKLELFIFDVLPLTRDVAVLEVPRETEFAPLKNAPGTNADSPETSKKAIMKMHKDFLIKAGAKVEGEKFEGTEVVEISPLVTYRGEGLENYKSKTVQAPAHLE